MMMKKDITPISAYNLLTGKLCYMILIMGMMLVATTPICAQETQADTAAQVETDSTGQVETEAEEVEEIEAIKSRMSLTADQFPDNTIVLKGLLRAKIEASYQKIPGRKVTFFTINAEGEETSVGDTITGANGIASLRLNKTNLNMNEEGYYSLLARFDGDDRMDGSESDLLLRPAKLIMEPIEADSTFTLSIQAMSESAEGPMPIAAAPVTVYVKRMFSSLKVAEGETDEAGMVELEFPSGLPGDEDGNLEITVKIEETEEYGNLTAASSQKWGYAVSSAPQERQRALWSPHPPTWMVITFFILMGAVWIHYAIIVINLFRIKAQGPHTTGKA